MPRRASKKTPVVISGYLYTDDLLTTGTALDTERWFAWLDADTNRSFYYQGSLSGISVRREVKQRGGSYWVAYRSVQGRLHKVYLGAAQRVTHSALEAALKRLSTIP